MKTKPFKITSIILTVVIGLYFWTYPYTSHKYVSNLKEDTHKYIKQQNQLYDSCSNYIHKIKGYAEINPTL